MNRFFIYTIIFLSFCKGQYYEWPTDAGRSLNANFGEFRDRHFHMGIDIKTGGVEGASVFAVQQGYISRMVTNFNGYGRALYIVHPDGKTSVYAHLSRFNPKLEGLLRYFQNKNSSYMLNHYFQPNEIDIEKGELIGHTGNTGHSFGPHLHFELRNSDEQPLNPQAYGFNIDDRQSPRLIELAMIPLDSEAKVNGSLLPVQIPFFSNPDGTYELADTLNMIGTVGFALRTIDKRQGFTEDYQLKTVELFIDGLLEYTLDYDLLDYSINDRVQLVRDHIAHRLNLGSFHNLFSIDDHAKATVQPSTLSGNLNLSPGYHKMTIKATDAKGNSAYGSGIIYIHPPIDLIIQDVSESGYELSFNIQSRYINIPLKDITCYPFSSSGFVDTEVEPVQIEKNGGGLNLTIDKRMIHGRSLQFIGKNKMGAFSKPLNWHPENIPVDYNSKPDITLHQSPAGVIIQVETNNLGGEAPTLLLNSIKEMIHIPLEQVQPFTFISAPQKLKDFSGVHSLNVKIKQNTDYTYKYGFTPAVATTSEQAVVVSQDKMCSLRSLKSTFYRPNLIWIDAVENSTPPPHGHFLSAVYQLQPFTTPLQDTVNIGIRYDDNVATMEKISLYYYDQDDGWTFIPSKNSKKRQVLTGTLKRLEAVTILNDDIPPVIRSTFPAHGGQYYVEDMVRLEAHVDDLLSGVDPEETAMTMTLNGQRLIYAYQPVEQKMSYDLLDPLPLGEHSMSVSVSDRAGNTASINVNFVIK